MQNSAEHMKQDSITYCLNTWNLIEYFRALHQRFSNSPEAD